ncbi:hypothetical protein KKE60_05205 [Patescibacteria group bacterium]|nr:hypothetical protein [Patescibacteria group bacterium]
MDVERLVGTLKQMVEEADEEQVDWEQSAQRAEAFANGLRQGMELVQQHLDHEDECRIAQEDAVVARERQVTETVYETGGALTTD